jgi:hypothetical protein
MSDTKTVILSLKDSLTNADGTKVKDTSDITQQQLQTLKKEDFEKLPNLSLGTALLVLINNKKNCKDLEEMSKMQRLLTAIRTKLNTGVGVWNIEKDSLLEIEQVFKTAPIEELNVNLHGQIYSKIQDLIRQLT